MENKTEKRRRFLINFAYIAVIIAIVYLLVNYALLSLMPFVIALIISAILQPLIRLITRNTKIGQKPAAIIVIILAVCTVGVLIAFLCIEVVVFSKDLISKIPHYYSTMVRPAMVNLIDNIQSILRNVDEDITIDPSTLIPQTSDFIPSFSSIFNVTSNLISSVPSVLVSIVICIISTVFISIDYPLLSKWCLHQLPPKAYHTVLEIKEYVTVILFKYIRSYAIILSITFLELCIYLLIAGLIKPNMFASVGTTILTAFLISVFDILPIVGTGTVLIPWAIIRILLGDFVTGIMLLVIYLLVMIVRNFIEPKIVGDQVGLHPVVTLMAMVAGTSLFGVFGLLGFPVTLALLKDLNDRGKIHIFKKLDK